MARMIPPVVDPAQAEKSPAEARVFGWLRNMTWGNATVLYSLPLKQHIRNSFGEIDFVVICEKGVLCVEIKGGGVERRNGQWGFTGRNKVTNWKAEGPYTQAQGNMKSLRTYLSNHLKPDDDVLMCRWACCVMTPDCVIKTDTDDTEIIPEITFNGEMKESDLPALFDRCFHYWRDIKHFPSSRDVPVVKDLNTKARDRLVTFLRGDFNFVPPLSIMLNRAEDQLLSMTQEQYRIISAMSINDRMMVEGAAGTGKTLLAAEQCRRSALKGESVLYLCFNNVIATYIREMFAAEKNNEGIDVFTFHELLMRTCNIEEVPSEDIEKFFTETLPETFQNMDFEDGTVKKYDRVIIDEGQDLMNTTAYLCIERFILGGWEKGKWTIYYDPNQNIFGTNAEFDDIWNTLRNSSCIFPLTVNCRNTRQIAEGNYAVTLVYKPTFMRADGEEIVYKTYSNKGQEAEQVFQEIRRLRSEGILRKDIVILSQYRIDNPTCCLCGVEIPNDIGRIVVDQTSNFANCKHIRFYTIQKFKGLEAKAVIMIDVDSFSDDNKRLLNYVGMSRARTYLEFFYDSKLSKERQERLLKSLL